MISKIEISKYPQVMQIWEASVRSAYHFWSEDDILYYQSIGENVLGTIDLYGVRNNEGDIIAFMGVADDEVELLFVDPNYMGQGIGTMLIKYAILELHRTKISVNEQNKKAFELYKKLGFSIVGRSETDSSGKPYPIIHLEIKLHAI